MAIPVNLYDLVRGRRVEGPRIEYIRSWNPSDVLHTMCAFANDIDGWGGGYIIIGVDFSDGSPHIIGIDRGSADDISSR